MSTLAREGSKLNQALEIFQENLGDENHRQTCLDQFQKQLNQKESTAATYYHLCVQKLNNEQQKVTDQVIASNRKYKYSAVKAKRGKDVAAHVHCFFTKREAERFNQERGYDQVVRGVQEVGKQIGAVA